MTDKEKILAKIESLLNETNYEPFTDEVFGRIQSLKELKSYINSLQEEPISKIWHNASEKSNEPEAVVIINPSDNTGDVLTRCTYVYQGRIWAYTSVLLKLDNPCNFGKNLQEESISEDLEEASKKYSSCIYLEEVLSDDDKEVLRERLINTFKAGAEWKTKQFET